MILVGIDTETTGPDPETALPIEVAVVVKEQGNPRVIFAESVLLYSEEWGENPSSPEAAAVHGIDNAFLRRHAYFSAPNYLEQLLDKILRRTEAPWAFVAHNAAFDKAVLARQHPEYGRQPWICTLDDIEHSPGSRKLGHLAADRGVLNPFPHTAIADILTMFKILEGEDFERVLDRSRSPAIVVRAVCSYEQRDKAKSRRYLWELLGGKRYEKCWVKRMKACDLEKERAECQALGFDVVTV